VEQQTSNVAHSLRLIIVSPMYGKPVLKGDVQACSQGPFYFQSSRGKTSAETILHRALLKSLTFCGYTNEIIITIIIITE